jgi:hypothetical protein
MSLDSNIQERQRFTYFSVTNSVYSLRHLGKKIIYEVPYRTDKHNLTPELAVLVEDFCCFLQLSELNSGIVSSNSFQPPAPKLLLKIILSFSTLKYLPFLIYESIKGGRPLWSETDISSLLNTLFVVLEEAT